MQDECTIYQELNSCEEGIFLLGFSADWWWEIYVNGKLCFSAMNEEGNLYGEICAANHSMLVHLHKGKNLLAVRIIRGLSSWEFSCEGLSGTPILAKVMLGPWLCSPDSGSISIRFLTGSDIAAGVEYRKKGDSNWKVRWHSQCGQQIRSDNHLVQLNNLCQGVEYDYRIIMRAPNTPGHIVYDDTIYSFYVPETSCEKVSFLFTADLQFSPEMQEQYIKTMFDAADFRTADFFVLGGDMCEYQNIRTDLIEGMIQCMIEHEATRKPLVFVRGNHELRGREAWKFHDFFALPNGRTYGIFRFGSTAFLIIDSWEDKPFSSKVNYTKYNLDEEFLQEEKAYLDNALQQPAWKNAIRRIVLAHGAVYSSNDSIGWMSSGLRDMTDGWFHGLKPLYRLDLWLSGHTHIHLRSIPRTDILAAPQQPPIPFRSGENDVYPVLTVGGPTEESCIQASIYRVDVEYDRMTVKAFDQNGKIIDHVIYNNDGSVQELLEIPHFHISGKEG